MADRDGQGREALGRADSDEPELLAQWVDSLWTATCPHGGGYARDCTRCVHETLYRSDWLKAHDAQVAATALRDAADAIYNGAGDPEQEFYDHGVSQWLRARADESNPR